MSGRPRHTKKPANHTTRAAMMAVTMNRTTRAMIAVLKTPRYSIAPNHFQSVYTPTTKGPMNSMTAMIPSTHANMRGGRFIGAEGRAVCETNASSNQIVCQNCLLVGQFYGQYHLSNA